MGCQRCLGAGAVMVLTENNLLNLILLANHPDLILQYISDLTSNFGSLNIQSPPALTPAKSNTPYERFILAASDQCEVMVAKWRANSPCAPHDHGRSKGWVFFLKGNFTETSYKFANMNLNALSQQTYRAGDRTEIQTQDIHSCVSETEGLTLHVYYPKISYMKVYDAENKCTYVVDDKCGAWRPESSKDILKFYKWNEASFNVPL